MGEYITKKTDDDKKESKWIKKKEKKKEWIKKKEKKKEYITIKKDKQDTDSVSQHKADIDKSVSAGVGYRDKKWIRHKYDKKRPQGGWKD